MASPGTEPGFLAFESAHEYEKSTQTVGGWIYAIMA